MYPAARDGSDAPWIRVEGEPIARARYRPATFLEVEDSRAWWGAVAALGGLAVLAGILAPFLGPSLAIGGVLLFLATAVLAGAERLELATTVGTAGMLWTAAGVSFAFGADRSPSTTALGFAAFGAATLVLAGFGIRRLRGRTKRISRPSG